MPLETVLAAVLGVALACNAVLSAALIRTAARRAGADRAAPRTGREARRDVGNAEEAGWGGDAQVRGLPAAAAGTPAAEARGDLPLAARPPAGPRLHRGPIVLSRDDIDAGVLDDAVLDASVREVAAGDASREPAGIDRVPPGWARSRRAAPAPDQNLDPQTRLDGPLAWEAWVRDETARLARYGRPVAIAVGEPMGIRRHEQRPGQEQAASLVLAVADAFRREARSCDRVARVGDARFAVLLPETDEQQALNYAERVRGACDRWFEAGGLGVRLAIGVAGPGSSGSLDAALRVAEERMYASTRDGGRDSDA